jgi:hypothetical protein
MVMLLQMRLKVFWGDFGFQLHCPVCTCTIYILCTGLRAVQNVTIAQFGEWLFVIKSARVY